MLPMSIGRRSAGRSVSCRRAALQAASSAALTPRMTNSQCQSATETITCPSAGAKIGTIMNTVNT